ncbi:capsule biosynthesis protein [Loktanella agnita]|uniref:capsule biosynthesis protein n=1 Tax=Loktanella agnita TaxID=287097 RepID=UPI003986FCE3
MSGHYLFLQGPHGPFFRHLGQKLCLAGAKIHRVGFNAGDAAFWRGLSGYIPYHGPPEAWQATLAEILRERQITDIVLYGDTRPIHAEAVRQAKDLGLRVHIFEEGYLRPYWVTYERGGSNGYSRLMDFSVADMRDRLARSEIDMPTPPAHWGDMRQHIFYGALYHWFVMFRNRRYAGFRPHRALSVRKEAALYTKRLALMPYVALERAWTTGRIKAGSFPYHLALLQLEHDASFQVHSPFNSIADFLEPVIAGFAKGAPRHHHLVFKAHPLENGQSPLRRLIADFARAHGIAGRVHYVPGGKLAHLLDEARSAVTVNSTAAQQVLWRGIPLKTFGASVYDKPEFVSQQALSDFFARPGRPDAQAYRAYRQFLLETSQVPGGYYSRKGRRQLLRHIVDMMLAEPDPYDALLTKPEGRRSGTLVKLRGIA